MSDTRITIDYFSDVLCVWAYGGQIRADELKQEFGDQVLLRQRFMSLFGDTSTRIGEGWQEQGGYEGFGAHLQEVCGQWEHVQLHDDVWTRCRPASSVTPHVFLKSASLCLGIDDDNAGVQEHAARERFDDLVIRVRRAFFENGVDVSNVDELAALLAPCGLSLADVRRRIDNGDAYAALHRDAEAVKQYGVQGSPTYVFNEGRQLLYGNVGYRIIESNVRELLSTSSVNGAPSWC